MRFEILNGRKVYESMPCPPRQKTRHQQRVEEFMRKAGQDVPEIPTIPSREVLGLRAKLILEECVETIEALGFVVHMKEVKHPEEGPKIVFGLEYTGAVDVVEIIDGCCDIKVVTTGTLSALGIADAEPQRLIDESNLQKFGDGSYKRDDGKWIKPPDWQKPNLLAQLIDQGGSQIAKNPDVHF